MENVPHVISEYFAYKNAHDKAGILSAFTDDAVVIDRGADAKMHGKNEIEHWIDTSLSGINLHSEISGMSEESGVWIIETIVTGDFAASPAKFIYRIEITLDKICVLDIEFAGSLRS